MGYGSCVYNEPYGYCYRTQQGCGTRLSPYFKTEKAAEGKQTDDRPQPHAKHICTHTYNTYIHTYIHTPTLYYSYFAFCTLPDFHDYLGQRAEDINGLLGRTGEDHNYIKSRCPSLYHIPLYICQKLAEDFEKDTGGEKIIVDPVGETREFFYRMDYYDNGEDKASDIMSHDVPLTRTMRKKFAALDEAWEEKKKKRAREVKQEEVAGQESGVGEEDEAVTSDESKETSPEINKKAKVKAENNETLTEP